MILQHVAPAYGPHDVRLTAGPFQGGEQLTATWHGTDGWQYKAETIAPDVMHVTTSNEGGDRGDCGTFPLSALFAVLDRGAAKGAYPDTPAHDELLADQD